MTKHPAAFPDSILKTSAPLLLGCKTALDPFAGSGRVFVLEQLVPGLKVFAVELEPEWAKMHNETIVGNALELPFSNSTFDAIVSSPCYGNRMADHHEARDGTYRRTYRHVLGRQLSKSSAGGLQWGQAYRDFHVAAWQEATRVCKPEARFVLNIKNHIRDWVEQMVTEWHLDTLARLGWRLVRHIPVETPGWKQGAHSNLRVKYESVCLLQN